MESFECAICFQRYEDPRVLPCGHTFCSKCLKQQSKKECAIDRKTFDVPPEALPVNFVVSTWMEENNEQPITKKKFGCENCDLPATLWCEGCQNGTYYCDKCSSLVHSLKATSKHCILTLKEKMKKPTFTRCNFHFQENQIFCVDCQVLICPVCMIDDHKSHNAMSAFKYSDVLRAELKSCVAPIEQKKGHLEQIERKIRTENENNEKKIVELTEQIKILEEKMKVEKAHLENILERKEKVETSNVVILKLIEEMGVMDLMTKENVTAMKKRIKGVFDELYPEVEEVVEEKKKLTWDLLPSNLKKHTKMDDKFGINVVCSSDIVANTWARVLGFTKAKSWDQCTTYDDKVGSTVYYLPSTSSSINEAVYYCSWGKYSSSPYPIVYNIIAE